MKEEQIESAMGAAALACNIVTAGFENRIPREHRVRIIQIAAVFSFEDGSKETYGPLNVDIGSGQDEVIMSTCNESCCTSIKGTMLLEHIPSGKTKVFSHNATAKPNTCLLVHRFIIEPKGFVLKSELDTMRRVDGFHLGYELRT